MTNKRDKIMTKNNKPTHAWGIAGLILGIIGFLLLFLAPNIGILFSITAVVFSVIQKKYEPTGVATAGLVLVSCQGYNVARNITYVFHNKSGMIEYEKIYRDTCQR